MSRVFTAFILTACLAAFLMELSIGLARYGYPAGSLGQVRLAALADAANFLPLAALYFLTCFLLMVLPVRAASFTLANGEEPIFWCVIVLIGAAAGFTLVRWGFGERAALESLWDWRHLLVLAVAAAHLRLSDIRGRPVLRALFALASLAMAGAALYLPFNF